MKKLSSRASLAVILRSGLASRSNVIKSCGVGAKVTGLGWIRIRTIGLRKFLGSSRSFLLVLTLQESENWNSAGNVTLLLLRMLLNIFGVLKALPLASVLNGSTPVRQR